MNTNKWASLTRRRCLCLVVAVGMTLCATAACGRDREMLPVPTVGQIMDSSSKHSANRASHARVFFAHQSVGSNTLEGLKALLKVSGTRWPIASVEQGDPPQGPALLHATPGENGDPKSKMDGFAATLATLRADRPELAFMKFCFTDITYETDVDAVFSQYQSTIAKLKSEYPDVVFGHVTVPLATRVGGVKDRIKRLAGIAVKEDLSNVRRTEFNRKLRTSFAGDPLLDLERVESTRPDGTREQSTVDGATAYALAPEYASDPWGHLNAPGAQLAARELLRFVADGVSGGRAGQAADGR
jgi:hypothetical protein